MLIIIAIQGRSNVGCYNYRGICMIESWHVQWRSKFVKSGGAILLLRVEGYFTAHIICTISVV